MLGAVLGLEIGIADGRVGRVGFDDRFGGVRGACLDLRGLGLGGRLALGLVASAHDRPEVAIAVRRVGVRQQEEERGQSGHGSSGERSAKS